MRDARARAVGARSARRGGRERRARGGDVVDHAAPHRAHGAGRTKRGTAPAGGGGEAGLRRAGTPVEQADDRAPQPPRHRPGQELRRDRSPARRRRSRLVGAQVTTSNPEPRSPRPALRPWRRPATAPPPGRCGTSPGPPAPGPRPRRRRRPTSASTPGGRRRRVRRARSRPAQPGAHGRAPAAAARAHEREQGIEHAATRTTPAYDVLAVRWIKESAVAGRCLM